MKTLTKAQRINRALSITCLIWLAVGWQGRGAEVAPTVISEKPQASCVAQDGDVGSLLLALHILERVTPAVLGTTGSSGRPCNAAEIALWPKSVIAYLSSPGEGEFPPVPEACRANIENTLLVIGNELVNRQLLSSERWMRSARYLSCEMAQAADSASDEDEKPTAPEDRLDQSEMFVYGQFYHLERL